MLRRLNLIQREVVRLVEEEDAFGLKQRQRVGSLSNIPTLNTRWRFLTTPQKAAAFQTWIKSRLDQTLLEAYKNEEDGYWKAYIDESFRKGAGRAFDDVRKRGAQDRKSLDFYEGTRAEFMRSSFGQPETVDKVKLLAGRVFTELQGVTQDTATKMSRVLTDGLAQGQNPRQISKTLVTSLGLSKNRANTIARTEIIRAHAEGQLDALEKLGIAQVGVAVEWSTAGDQRVCPLCQPMDGVVYPIAKAHGLIPRHPNCRCSFLPANVGESAAEQLRRKSEIAAAVRKSVRAEMPKKGKRTLAQQMKLSRWAGADAKPEAAPTSLVDEAKAAAKAAKQGQDAQGWPKEIIEGGTKEELEKLFALTKQRDILNKKVKLGTATVEEIEAANRVKQELADLRAAIRERIGFETKKKVTVKPVKVKPTPTPKPTPSPKPTPAPTPAPAPTPVVVPATTPAPSTAGVGMRPGNPAYDALPVLKKLKVNEDLNDLMRKVEAAISSEAEEALEKASKRHSYVTNRIKKVKADLRTQKVFLDTKKVNPAQYEANTREFVEELKQLQQEQQEAIKELGELQTSTGKAAVLKALEVPEQDRMRILPNFDRFYPATDKQQAKAKEAAEFLSKITQHNRHNPKEATVPVYFHYESQSRFRAFYRREGYENGVHIASNESVPVIVHEMGHHLEYLIKGQQGNNLLKASNEFRAARIKKSGSKDVFLREKFGRRYADTEVGNPDDFEKLWGKDNTKAYYAGRDYSKEISGPEIPTEVLTLGVETLAEDPITFARKDPEYFRFIVAALRGLL